MDFATAIADDLDTAIRAFSATAKLKAMLASARAAVGEVTVGLPGGVSVSVGPGSQAAGPSILEDRLARALIRVGQLASKAERGVAFLYDEAHTPHDQPRQRQYALSALLGAFVQAQDEDEPPLPVMLVISGLPPLVQNLQAARSHTERLFRVEELGNLALASAHRDQPSPAALALIKPAVDTGIRLTSSRSASPQRSAASDSRSQRSRHSSRVATPTTPSRASTGCARATTSTASAKASGVGSGSNRC